MSIATDVGLVFPECFDDVVTPAEIQEALRWLSLREGVMTVVLQLRMPSWWADQIRPHMNNPVRFHEEMLWSYRSQLSEVLRVWNKHLRRGSLWADPLHFPGLHSCGLRGPVRVLEQFLEDPVLHGADCPVAGLVMADPLHTPEAIHEERLALQFATNEVLNLMQTTVPLASEHDPSFSAARMPSATEVQSAVWQEGWKKLRRTILKTLGYPDAEEEAAKVMQFIPEQGAYIDQLGLGELSRWGATAGRGEMVCVIDSGCDESHPMLRRQVRDYARFDYAGQLKEAYACTDNACHGTKCASLIAGKSVLCDELALSKGVELQLGIAPAAKLAVVSALGGELKQEGGTLTQLIAALEWVESAPVRAPDRFRHCHVVNLSAEAGRLPSREAQRAFDRVFALLRQRGIAVICAAGNCGVESKPLGTSAVYVGAASRQGVAATTNGSRHNLLAPGDDLLCAQPLSPALGERLIGCYSGSSMAAAVVSGVVAALVSRKGCSALKAVAALEDTAKDNGFIDPLEAEKVL